MRSRLSRAALFALAYVASACSSADVVTPDTAAPVAPRFSVTATRPAVVISQIYGGGGNSGATYRNDFIELHNAGTTSVSVAGWSVQYASSSGTTWGVTALTGTIPAGGYFLVQQAAGTGGTINLPTPNATGLIAMSGTAGKVILASSLTAQSGTCPDGADVVDRVGYGASSCPAGDNTPAPSNTLAVLRGANGCAWTRNNAVDFATGTPAPRNSATAAVTCSAGPVVGPIATIVVTPATTSVPIGGTRTFTVVATDANNLVVSNPAITWSTSAPLVASIGPTGVATALDIGSTTISATAANGVLGTAALTVTEAASLPSVRISEIHYDNAGTDVGEAIEIEAPASTDLTGWQLLLYNGNGGAVYNTRVLSGVVASTCTGRGVLYFEYPQDGIQNGSPDGVALVNAQGTVVEFLSYEGVFTATDGAAAGTISTNIVASEDPAPGSGNSLQRSFANTWSVAVENFGGCNGRTPGVLRTTFGFSGRTPSDPALPVGFQDQIFANASRLGVAVPGTILWSSVTPAIASIDASGVITGLAAGTAVLRATTADGLSSGTYALPIDVATAGNTAAYGNNTEFGTPFDGTPADDFIIERPQYAASYSKARNTPNWVAYNLEATHIGSFDRCDCFTYDPALPADYPRYTTADYTGAGAIAGYGIDRGHLARSFDRTTGALDNARTFYFSNIIPQAADNNQGPWAALENDLGARAQNSNKEVFIVAGVAGNKGTVKNEGKIVIPEFVWKVAVILPRNQGLANVTSLDAAEIVAVVMPNVAGIRNVAWTTYKTTVDSVEALSGYDLLSLLRNDIEIALESNTKPPVAAVNGPFNSLEDESVAMSASASTDPDGDALTFAWSFGDGATATGVTTSHVYTTSGTFTVRLIATDIRGLADTVTTTATVLSPAQALDVTTTMVDALAGTGRVNQGVLNSLKAKLNAAANSIRRGNATAAMNQLEALINELDALVRSRGLTELQVAPIRTMLTRVIRSLSIS
ncbi:DNA/RNA non-specific endonuclease [Gemmatimonas sp.]|uniref:DNA/RNA non-specific endonuclease n=1 Tax=Gemmatimonas sp. TaxID=1962908 RepID=UPI0039831DB6